MKAVIVGIDGAGWNFLLHPSLSGSNSRFEEIAYNNISGDLISTTPPVTGPAWVSFATGCNPGQHGCFGFLMPKEGLSRTAPITTRSIARPTFYEILEKVGKKCILVNLPCSYPPKTSGIIITSLLTHGDRFIFPQGIEDEIPALNRYRPFPNMALLARKRIGEYLRDAREVERIRFECSKELFETNWDLFFVLFSAIDWGLHAIRGGIKDAASDRDMQKICQDIETYVGWFIDNCPQDAYVFLMSDHGFRDYLKPFYVNALLKQKGFLHLEESDNTTARPHRLFEEYSSSGVKLRIPSKFVSILRSSPHLMDSAFKILKVAPIQMKSKIHLVPATTSVAACLSPGMSRFGTIYLGSKTGNSVEIGSPTKVLQDVRHSLLKVEDPYSGDKIVRKVWLRDELYHGKACKLGPHLILETNPHYWINNDLTYPRLTTKKSRVDCNHDLYGIYSAVSEEPLRKFERNRISIEDVTPTILSNYDIPLPEWMDGKPIFKMPSR